MLCELCNTAACESSVCDICIRVVCESVVLVCWKDERVSFCYLKPTHVSTSYLISGWSLIHVICLLFWVLLNYFKRKNPCMMILVVNEGQNIFYENILIWIMKEFIANHYSINEKCLRCMYYHCFRVRCRCYMWWSMWTTCMYVVLVTAARECQRCYTEGEGRSQFIPRWYL